MSYWLNYLYYIILYNERILIEILKRKTQLKQYYVFKNKSYEINKS